MESDIKANYNVVLVDDEAEVRELFSKVVENEGYNCFTYSSGESFLEAYNELFLEKTVLVVDVMMPGMTGLEMLERLAAGGGLVDIPVLFLTSYPDDTEIADSFTALNALALDYMSKPFSGKWLLAKLKNLLKIAYTHDRLLSMSEELIEAYSRISNVNIQIENLLQESLSKNDYLVLRLKKILHDKDEEKSKEDNSFKKQIQIVKELFSKIITTDMYLIKSVDLFLEKLNTIYFKIYYEESSDTEFMELLPETLISIHTLLADIETMKELMQNIGIISADTVSCSDYQSTNIYKCLENLLERGDITRGLFEQFVKISEPEIKDDGDDVILF